MKTVSCNLCGLSNSVPYRQLTDRFTHESFQLVRCINCDLIYLNPRPTMAEIGRYYPPDYEPHHVANDASTKWHIERLRQIQLDFVEKYHPVKGNLLDIGCATGEFLVAARDRGWQVEGIELVEEAAQVAREKHQLHVHVGAVETVLDEDGVFDVITMWDVLEHLFDPQTIFKRCAKTLKQDGKLVFTVPNLDSYDRRLFGNDWVGWEAPRHLYFFTNVTLPKMLEATGFELVDEKCIVGGKGTFQISLATKLQENSLAPMIDKISPLLLAALWPYRQLSYWQNKGSVITYVAKKRA